MNCYDLWLDNIEGYEFSTTANTPGKAKRQYYQYLQFGVWETDYKTFLKYARYRKVN